MTITSPPSDLQASLNQVRAKLGDRFSSFLKTFSSSDLATQIGKDALRLNGFSELATDEGAQLLLSLLPAH